MSVSGNHLKAYMKGLKSALLRDPSLMAFTPDRNRNGTFDLNLRDGYWLRIAREDMSVPTVTLRLTNRSHNVINDDELGYSEPRICVASPSFIMYEHFRLMRALAKRA